MSGAIPTSDMDQNPIGGGEGNGESRVIITGPQAADMKQAVDDHFQRAFAAFAQGQQSPRQFEGRDLPKAFFSKPPIIPSSSASSSSNASSIKSKTSSNTPLSHSRDGSTDSSGRYTLSPPATGTPTNVTGLSPLVQHSRTHSSPAIISHAQCQSYSPNQPNQQPQRGGIPAAIPNPSPLVHHQKHRSFDNTLESDPSMQHLWQQHNPYGGSGGGSGGGGGGGVGQLQMHQQHGQFHQQMGGEKTSKSLGDLATSTGGMDTFDPAAYMQQQQQQRKVSCNDPSAVWNEMAGVGGGGQKPQGQPQVQQPQQQQHQLVMRQHPRNHQHGGVSSVPSGSVRSQILKRQQQQQLMNQQLSQGGHSSNPNLPAVASPTSTSMAAAYANNSIVHELNQERQRMYERNMQLRQQGLLDPLPAATLPLASAGSQIAADLMQSPYNTNNIQQQQQQQQHRYHQIQQQHQSNPSLYDPHHQHQQLHHHHPRQGSTDSGLEMQAYLSSPNSNSYSSISPGAYSSTQNSFPLHLHQQHLLNQQNQYLLNQNDVDLNFANISLDPSSLMDVDPSGPLDIAPDDLDQYLNH